MDAEMYEEVCEECGKAEATTHPIVYEEWGPVPMCEECASHYEDDGEVLYMDAPPSEWELEDMRENPEDWDLEDDDE